MNNQDGWEKLVTVCNEMLTLLQKCMEWADAADGRKIVNISYEPSNPWVKPAIMIQETGKGCSYLYPGFEGEIDLDSLVKAQRLAELKRLKEELENE